MEMTEKKLSSAEDKKIEEITDEESKQANVQGNDSVATVKFQQKKEALLKATTKWEKQCNE